MQLQVQVKVTISLKTVQLGLPPRKGLLLLDWHLVTYLPCDPAMGPYGRMTGGNLNTQGSHSELSEWLDIVSHSVRCRIVSEICLLKNINIVLKS